MPRPQSSYTALTWVKDALTKTFPYTPINISRPAVVVKFGAGYETWEVIPGFITNRGAEKQLVYDIPGPSAGSAWIDSAPDEHLTYVNDANHKPHQGDAKDLARLVKAWKYYRSVPISSFYLEMRAAEHVKKQKHYIHVWDGCQLLESLDSIGLASMNDPKHAAGRIYACSSEANLKDAQTKLKRAAIRARAALDADLANKPDGAFYYLDKLFNGKFPARRY